MNEREVNGIWASIWDGCPTQTGKSGIARVKRYVVQHPHQILYNIRFNKVRGFTEQLKDFELL